MGLDQLTARAEESNAKTSSTLLERITAEPAYRVALFKMLEFCMSSHSATEIAERVSSFPEMQAAFHSPEILLSWMIQAGGIERMQTEQEGERWKTTEAGSKVLENCAPAKLLGEMFSREPLYHNSYKLILKYCETPRTTAEIDAFVEANQDLGDGMPRAMFFIQSLEKSGGLEWVGKWHTTVFGQRLLA